MTVSHMADETHLPPAAALNRENLDLASRPSCPCDSRVPGKENAIKELSERDVGGVVGGQVVPQFPAALQKWTMVCAIDGKIAQVLDRSLCALRFQFPRERESAPRGRDLYIDQCGGGEVFPDESEANPGAGVIV